MAHRWGNDDHGPGGDPSWLGGRDRGSGGESGSGSAGSTGGWASGFSSDVGARRDSGAAEEMAPRFGEVTGDEASSQGRDSQSPWMPGFAERTSQGSGGDGSMVRQLFGVLVSVVVLGIFVVVFLSMGMGSWWILLFAGVPLLMRVVRILRRNLGG